jgi:tyrosinase
MNQSPFHVHAGVMSGLTLLLFSMAGCGDGIIGGPGGASTAAAVPPTESSSGQPTGSGAPSGTTGQPQGRELVDGGGAGGPGAATPDLSSPGTAAGSTDGCGGASCDAGPPPACVPSCSACGADDGCGGVCTSGCRRNQATLTATERAAFVNAVLALKHMPSRIDPPTASLYDDYVQIHVEAMKSTPMWAHMGPAFLPWHREMLRRFELDLQTVDPTVTIPYWDWTVDTSPSAAPFTPDFMGGNGRSGDHRVMDGPFAHDAGNWTLTVVDSDNPNFGPDLRRNFGSSSDAATLPVPADVDDALSIVPYDAAPWDGTTDTQPSFRNRLEGWYGQGALHLQVHLWVAGGTDRNNFTDAGTMRWATSPDDPIFWLHHANIDRIWANWQRRYPDQPYQPVTGGPQGHNLNDPMNPWRGSTTPASVLDFRPY